MDLHFAQAAEAAESGEFDHLAVFKRDTKRALVLAVTSGKGGVGKTFVSSNLAAALSGQGLRVLIIDADMGLANLDVVLNLVTRHTLHDVFEQRVSIDDAIVKTPFGFDALLAGSGFADHSKLSGEMRHQYNIALSAVLRRYDIILLDTGAGIADLVLFSVSMADEVLLVTTPEPTALTDAYATIKVLAAHQRRKHFRVIINQVQQEAEAAHVLTQLQKVVHRFVPATNSGHITLHQLGFIPSDVLVRTAISKRRLLYSISPSSAPGVQIGNIATRICGRLKRWQS